MPFDLNFKSTFLLVFFIHLLVYAVLLFKKGAVHRSYAWLGLLVLLGALYLCPFLFGYANWYAQDGYRELLLYFPFQQLLLIGPVIYAYIQFLLYKKPQTSQYLWLHFVPGLLYLIYSLLMWISDVFILQAIYFYADGKDKDLKFGYQIIGFTSMAYYLIKSIRLYVIYRKHTLNNTSFAETVSLGWVRYFLTALLSVIVMKVVVMMLVSSWGNFGHHFTYYLMVGVLFYFLAIQGYSSSYQLSTHPMTEMSQPGTKNNLSDAEIEICRRSLESVMKGQRCYLDPRLTLSQLSAIIGFPDRLVSKTINQINQMNFNDYINSFRIKAFIERYPDNDAKTLLDLALDCGFNSKATFNRAFKKHTKTSPKAYFSSTN